MTPLDDPAARSSELEAITRDYARYAERAGGVSAIAGGVLCLASLAIGAFVPASPAVRLVLLAIPVVWLVLKQGVATRYYQRMGRVGEVADPGRADMHRGLVAGVSVVVAIACLGLLMDAMRASPPVPPLQQAAQIALVLAIPLVAWRWLRTPLDLVVGCFLLCQAALAVSGRSFGLLSPALLFVPAALLMIGAGWRDHRRFRELQRRIQAFASGATP